MLVGMVLWEEVRRKQQKITGFGPYNKDLYHKLVFAYRKGHGCDALLSLTERWRKEFA